MPALRPLLTLPRRLRPSFTRHFSPIPDTAFLNADNTVLRTFLPPADIAPFPTFSRRLLCPLLSSTPLSQPAPAPTRRLSRVPAPADAASLNSVMPPLPAPTASHIAPPVAAFFLPALFFPIPDAASLNAAVSAIMPFQISAVFFRHYPLSFFPVHQSLCIPNISGLLNS